MPSAAPFVRCLLVASAGFGLVVACSGATTQDVFSASPDGGASSGTSGTSSGTTSSSSTSSGSVDAGAPDAGPCTPEVEPNDTENQANELAPSRCGAIQPQTDVDFLTFTLKPTTSTMEVKFDGKVTLRITVANQTVTLGNGTGQKVPFVQGKPYFIEIQPTLKQNSTPWRVDLLESP
jgi:hypothetical protein